ncbi:MAG: protein kinase [Planctomycetes bacterium]|nr:protein kinase [Planctomycetota bacterium]
MDRIDQALPIYLAWLESTEREEPAALLARHPELREVLQAMLEGREAPQEGATAGVAEARVVGGFRILEEVGRGGMGVVYRARQLSLDRPVALKVLPAHLTLQPSVVARFRREASIAARLEHPAIVAIHAVGSEGDTHYIAMEWIDGAPLARTDPRTGAVREVRETVELCAVVADALEYAHQHGVVHRDVKPSNILLRADGRPVLSDFGLARDQSLPELTSAGEFAGTPHYVSPEQAAGAGQADARSDVFSLGATLYFLLTGQKPFGGASTHAVLQAIATAEPVDPLRLDPTLSPDLAAIVLKALEKNPARRYPSAAALAADLRAFLAYRPVSARRASGLARVRRWARREPLRATLAAVLALGIPALSALLGFLLANAQVYEVGAAELAQRRLDEQLARVTIDYEAGDYGRARVAADAALALAPESVEALAMATLVRIAQGERDQALALLERAAAEHAEVASIRRVQAWAASALGQDERASSLDQLLGPPRTPVDWYLHASRSAQRLRREGGTRADWEQVRAAFARAMHISPAPRQHFHLRWLDAILATRDAAATREAVATLQDLWPESPAVLLYVGFALRETDPRAAAAAYRKVLASGYEHPRILSELGMCLARGGDVAGARAYREQAVAGYEARARAGTISVVEQGNLAIALYDVGRREEAVLAGHRAVAMDANARTLEVLGFLLEGSGDARGAADAFRRALQVQPRAAAVLGRLGPLLLRLKEDAEAVRVLRTWAEVVPDDHLAHHHLGNALLAAGDAAGAVAANRRAVECQPRIPELHFNLALSLDRMGDHSGAIAAFDRALALRPDYVRALQQRGWTREQKGDLEGCLADYRAALVLRPESPELLLGVGRVLHRRGDLEGARKVLRQAAALPMSAAVCREIAGLQAASGDAEGARATVRLGIERAKEAGERSELETALAGLPGSDGR